MLSFHRRSFLFAVSLFIFSLSVHAQSTSTLIGARATGMGFASSTLKDDWSLFNNAAGLAHITSMNAACTYRAVPSFKSFNSMAFLFNTPAKYGVASAGVFRFGDDLYNEQILSAGFANKFGLASLGAKINFLQYYIEGFGFKRVITFSSGGIADLTKKISIGAHIINVNQPSLSESEFVPAIILAGVSFKPSDELTICTEIEKDLEFDATFKAGMEYKPYPKFAIRTGFNIQPQNIFLGFGYTMRKILVDYAYQYNEHFGSIHQITTGYKIKQH